MEGSYLNKFALIILGFYLLGHIDALNIEKNAKIDIIVSMKEGVNQVHEKLRFHYYKNREARLNAVYDAFTKYRDATQRHFLNFLNDKGIWYNSFWITNQVYIPNVDYSLLEKIQNFSGVSEVSLNEEYQLESLIVGEDQPETKAQWGVETIEAPRAWVEGWRGAGAKIGIVDTGVRYSHEAISGSYVNDGYGWLDPYNNSSHPTDNNGHGTHVTGIIAGSEASGVGVAPDAKWMACASCNDGGGCGRDQIIICSQFMMCPTDPYGNNPICSKAPHVIVKPFGGGLPIIWYEDVLKALDLAGIVVVFAQGNSGPSCGSVNFPGTSELVFGVGASTSTDNIASFSSRGPVIGSDRIKPDCTAPGQNIRSSYHTSDTAYSSLSGTSMAGPHVAGALALMFGKNPNMTIDEAKTLLFNSTDRDLPITGQNCGGVDENIYPNNVHGWGRINAFKAAYAA